MLNLLHLLMLLNWEEHVGRSRLLFLTSLTTYMSSIKDGNFCRASWRMYATITALEVWCSGHNAKGQFCKNVLNRFQAGWKSEFKLNCFLFFLSLCSGVRSMLRITYPSFENFKYTDQMQQSEREPWECWACDLCRKVEWNL